MVRTSKQQVEKDVLKQINNRLVDVVSKLETDTSARSFLDDLLSESEKIVLAKRLSIIFMLYEKISWYRISVLLKVSQTTVKKVASDIGLEKYENILKIVRQKKNRVTFWEGMDIVLRCGMPPIVGKGRWNFLEKYGY
ncbi:MAG: Trp family transcriptional regulator [Patescibacteria group bacterium]